MRTATRFVLIPLLMLIRPEGAEATADPPATEVVGQIVRYVIYGDTGEVTIPIEDGGVTILTFPDVVKTAYRVGNPNENSPIGIRQGERDVTLWTQRKGSVGARARAVFAIEGLVVNATIRVIADPQASVRSASFVKRPPPSEVPEGRQGHELPDPVRSMPSLDNLLLAKNVLTGNNRLSPVVKRDPRQEHPFDVQLGDAVLLDGRLYASFELTNPGPEPLVLSEIRVTDVSGQMRAAERVSLEPPAMPASGSIAAIPPGKRASGVLLVPEARYGGLGPQAFQFEAGLGTVATPVDEWRFVARRSPIEDIYAPGWRSLHGLASFGAVWLPANVTLATGFKLDEVRSTMFTAFGLRYTYNPAQLWWWSVEGEVVYASTGEVRFENVMLNTGVQGDLVRRARLGRVQLGMLLRLGGMDRFDRHVVARGGVAVQGAFYDAEIVGMEAPGSGFDVAGLWYVGLGLVIPVSKRCGLTPLASYARKAVRDEQFLGLGLDFGCAWKPGGD